MNAKNTLAKNSKFYKQYHQISPSLILGLTIITLGLYIINWLYLRNKEFETLDTEAPDSNRGAIIMMIFPFAWFFIMQVLRTLIFTKENLAIEIINIVGWGIIFFLILKYLLDFCISFGRVTQTQGFFWFFLFFLGIVGIICFLFDLYLLGLLFIFVILSIPAMQAELNSRFSRYAIKKENNIFYH